MLTLCMTALVIAYRNNANFKMGAAAYFIPMALDTLIFIYGLGPALTACKP